ncbi:hypothetical protein ACFS5L_34645 [Streptomyces phyllanthi]|uniref:Uncharacterized protein n=1 Tax=Streptomyces phyllanthi TaxID=1803180 RepID=A0A5N8WCI1_9ACTN|nr:hypothetical protein [Streptomyces phyllanthi]MPY44842.1 hypothetical protein [Streptomyces phyllanthi]
MILVLLGVLALVVGGCVCVVWAARGGPRWVRVVSTVTVTAGELLSAGMKGSRGRNGSSSSDE